MLSFNKGMNIFNKNNSNVDQNKYARFGRVKPEEIAEQRYKQNMNNINKHNEPLKEKNMGNMNNNSMNNSLLNGLKRINK